MQNPNFFERGVGDKVKRLVWIEIKDRVIWTKEKSWIGNHGFGIAPSQGEIWWSPSRKQRKLK